MASLRPWPRLRPRFPARRRLCGLISRARRWSSSSSGEAPWLAETFRIRSTGHHPAVPPAFGLGRLPPAATAPPHPRRAHQQSRSEVARDISKGIRETQLPGTAGTWAGTACVTHSTPKAGSPRQFPEYSFHFFSSGLRLFLRFLPCGWWGDSGSCDPAPQRLRSGDPRGPCFVSGWPHLAPAVNSGFLWAPLSPSFQPASPHGGCVGHLSTSHYQILEGLRSSGSTPPSLQPLGPALRPDTPPPPRCAPQQKPRGH